MEIQSDIIDAKELLQRAGVDVGMNVADFGTGREGGFVLEAARLVTETGRVFALDVVKEILSVIEGMARDAGVHNVTTIWTDLEMYGAARDIADNTIDVGVLANTLFQSQKRDEMMKECVRMMKPGGTLLIVEWKPGETAIGPPLAERVAVDEISTIAKQLGLEAEEQFEAGEYHWGMLLRK